MKTKPVYEPSLEGAQHGGKSLQGLLQFAKGSGAAGAQPSNFHLENGKGGFKSAAEIQEEFGRQFMRFHGISAHCPFWVMLSAWTGTPTIRPFIPAHLHTASVTEIENWASDYLYRLMDLASELNVRVMPMFWGLAYGLEAASGYPWGLWKGPGYDLIQEGEERFVKMTKGVRKRAAELDIKLCHEIHPGTAAATSGEFQRLVEICDGDQTLCINADPSHCWEGESWEQRLLAGGDRIYAAHIKNHHVRPGFPLRSMESDWTKRGMQFTDLPSGDINMQRYAEVLAQIGYPKRYRQMMGGESAPLVVEAESAYRELDSTSRNGIEYVRDNFRWAAAEGSFEDGLGAK